MPAKNDPLRDACEAMFKLLISGKPIFPQIAAEFDMTPPQLHLLRLLGETRGEGIPMRAVAEQLYCDASYVTAIVDRLEERELIARTPDPADRRVKRIVLTKAGDKIRSKALERLFTPPPGMKKLSAADQKSLRDILRRAVELQQPLS